MGGHEAAGIFLLCWVVVPNSLQLLADEVIE